MPLLDVRADTSAHVRYLNQLKAGLGDQVIVASLNKTIASTNTMMVRGIAAVYNVNQSVVRDKLSIAKATRRGGNFAATLIGNPYGTKRRALNVIRFLERKVTIAEGKRRKKAGTLTTLQFQILKGHPRSGIPGAFILNVPGTPVFRRIGKARKDIEPIYTVGIPQMFSSHRVQDPILAAIPDEFAKQFDQATSYFASRLRQ